jgi:hypothetical protein
VVEMSVPVEQFVGRHGERAAADGIRCALVVEAAVVDGDALVPLDREVVGAVEVEGGELPVAAAAEGGADPVVEEDAGVAERLQAGGEVPARVVSGEEPPGDAEPFPFGRLVRLQGGELQVRDPVRVVQDLVDLVAAEVLAEPGVVRCRDGVAVQLFDRRGGVAGVGLGVRWRFLSLVGGSVVS